MQNIFKKTILTFGMFVMSILFLTNTALAETFKVTFSYSGTSQTITVNEGEKVQPIETPTKEGYTFYRWKNSKTQTTYDFSQPVTENLILQAQWRKNKGTDMQEIVAGDLDQSDITGVNPGQEFGLTKEKVMETFLDRLDYVALGLAGFGIVMILLFVIVYNYEKKRSAIRKDKKSKKNSELLCHKCQHKLTENDEICPNCGVRTFVKK